ncbi:MAG: SDR family oxidoreductase [Thauera sp.]|jgi:meso-butanediol dehydrogenase/(S,S)-butanediol dehydrogenase/diacetyl reductase|nr:SDR family oxidoreductase [Thauera sp.]
MARLDNKVCLITGAGSGIGAACVQDFLAEGARAVIALDIDLDALQALQKLSGKVEAFQCDVADAGAFDALVRSVVARHGRLDVLVNNVGVSISGTLSDTSDQTWQQMLDLNLSSAFYGLRAALKCMQTTGGSIINISSGAGLNGSPGMGAYGAAKAAMIHLTKTAAVENAASRTRINCVVPGTIATAPLLAWLDNLPGGRQRAESRMLNRRMGDPQEVAKAVSFLASDDASYINGTTLVVDGGVSAQLASIPWPQTGADE